MPGSYVGVAVKRLEDPQLLRGRGTYVGDVRLPGMLHAAIFRSPYAHARIKGIDICRARALPGVVAVFTAEDVGPVGVIPMRRAPRPSLAACLQPPIALGRARYVGEPLAVVVATSRYVAEDALELLIADLEPLPVVADARKGLAPDAPVLHPTHGTNIADRIDLTVGDVERALAEAPVRLRSAFSIQRHTGVPLETRGLVAAFDVASGMLTVWGPTKAPHFTRSALAGLLRHPEAQTHVIEPEVGGGFGVRGEFYPEDFLIPCAAKRLGRAVQWIEDRREHFLATNHSREQTHEVELGARRDGTIVALRSRVLVDMGAYVRSNGTIPAQNTVLLLPGPYRVRHYAGTALCVLTNKTPVGSYRSPGRYESTFVRERLVDLVARELGLDPAEVRRRNFIGAEEMPYRVGTSSWGEEVVYDSGNYAGAFEAALDAAGYTKLRDEQAEARARGRYVGIGTACAIENSEGGWETGRVVVEASGHVVVFSGAAAVGQGLRTVLAQICASELGLSPDAVTVVHGDTARVPEGMGAWGSRGSVMAGNAVFAASRLVREKALALAAYLLEAHPGDLELEDGAVWVRGLRDRRFTLGELAEACLPGRPLPPCMEPGLEASSRFELPGKCYPYGSHVAQVEVDPDFGGVSIRKYVIAYDLGRAINPLLVEGQLMGGMAQGIGGALHEELVYDDQGQLLTGSFMDYPLPTASDMPAEVDIRILEDQPSPLNPLGLKGVGEGGTVAAGATIANAVEDALAPLGVRVTSLPLTPARVRALIEGAQHGSAETP
jgi:carbon-monoxide dehydrogenase large subunit